MIPLNLIPPGSSADYAITGYWARAAYDEAALVGRVRIAIDTREADGAYRRVPRSTEVAIDPGGRLPAPLQQQHDLRHPVGGAPRGGRRPADRRT